MLVCCTLIDSSSIQCFHAYDYFSILVTTHHYICLCVCDIVVCCFNVSAMPHWHSTLYVWLFLNNKQWYIFPSNVLRSDRIKLSSPIAFFFSFFLNVAREEGNNWITPFVPMLWMDDMVFYPIKCFCLIYIGWLVIIRRRFDCYSKEQSKMLMCWYTYFSIKMFVLHHSSRSIHHHMNKKSYK